MCRIPNPSDCYERDLPLDVRSTAFQHRVWQALREIPAGSTGESARRTGAPKAVRAVAQACASNLIDVAIPCHRVVRMTGGLPATDGVWSASARCASARTPYEHGRATNRD